MLLSSKYFNRLMQNMICVWAEQVPGWTEVTGREVDKRRHRLSSTVSTVYLSHTIMHFDTTRTQRLFVQLQCHCYIESPPHSLFMRQRIGQSDARRLSPARNFTRYTKEKQNQYENTTRYNRLLIYCSVIARQRKDVFPGQMLEYHPLNKQWD